MYKDESYIETVNKTYSKSFSKKQLLPKFIIGVSKSSDIPSYASVLDYGSGKDAYGMHMLKEYFMDVTAYDVGNNFNTVWHDPNALSRIYDIVMMSNVINVQPSVDDIVNVLTEGKNCLAPRGCLYCNLPKKPRKSDITDTKLCSIMDDMFNNITWNMISNVYIGRDK